MESRIEQAVARKHAGMNCAQAVALTYADLANVSEDIVLAAVSGLGTGIGASFEGTCGAITGAVVILGLIKKNSSRMEIYKDAKYINTKFLERNKAVTCKILKGFGTGKVLRECDDCVRDACEFLEDILNGKV